MKNISEFRGYANITPITSAKLQIPSRKFITDLRCSFKNATDEQNNQAVVINWNITKNAKRNAAFGPLKSTTADGKL
jgi:hypothetical protein